MGDRVIAETQYNDLVGTAAFDGHEHPPLDELAKYSKMPSKDYWPVGFELSRLDPDENGNIPFTLLAVKCEESGKTIDEIIQYAQTAEEIRVYRFEGTLKVSELEFFFKRVDIKTVIKDLQYANVVAYYPPQK